ncbi:MAG: [acyl-carrier-protein] S-malonyltransferase, partial [Dehalococcoidales bacterium]|nr:[acyl-carrier-protein] S-malonyltransferase [Dehalococcoidales bacterium]
IPVVGNTAAQLLTRGDSVKAELLEQLCNCVQWQRSVECMVNNGVSSFIEIGPGKVLTGLVRRINREVKTANLGDLASIKNLGNPSV